MNFDEIEGLNEERIIRLYDSILEIDNNFISATIDNWYCTGYCTCYNGTTNAGAAYWNQNLTNHSYAGNYGILCVSAHPQNIVSACGTDYYTSRQYFTRCSLYGM